ncbi:hypothetical protein AX17_005842 [Amanita inopinata Kibby_2008]|nr:hypothetical protein AX17_005842 [Amanita inopinata Kibby_2008]
MIPERLEDGYFMHAPPQRHYVTAPPPPSGQPVPNSRAKQGMSNNAMLLILGAITATGAYFYLWGPAASELPAKTRTDREDMKHKAREALEAGKTRASNVQKQAETKYQDGVEEDKVRAARATAEQTLQDTGSRAKGLGSEVGGKYDSYKDTANNALSKARGSVEQLYDGAHSATAQKVADVRSEASKTGEQVKKGWLSWLGWGKSEVEKTENQMRDTMKGGARGVASAAGETKERTERYANDK